MKIYMISSAGIIKYNCSNIETLFGLYTKYATKCNVCVLVTLSNIGVYRKIFESGLAKQYIVFDEGFNAIKLLCKRYNVKFVEINSENILDKIEGKNMKFDLVIGNPPYTRGGKDTRPLYIEILSKIIENAKKTIWICPTQWVFGYNIKGNVINDFKNKYFLSDYEHITNPFENTNMANLIGIYTFDNNPNKIDYEEIFYNQFSNPEMTKNILQKYKNYPKHLSDYNNIEHNYKFYVNAALIRGHIDQATGKKKWDWTTLFGETQRTVFDKKLKDRNVFWNMKTLKECKNFVTENEYDVMEFAQFMGKSNSNIFLELTPWFDDYTVLRTENEIAKKLKLTKEEVEYIHQEMKNFGWKVKSK